MPRERLWYCTVSSGNADLPMMSCKSSLFGPVVSSTGTDADKGRARVRAKNQYGLMRFRFRAFLWLWSTDLLLVLLPFVMN